MTGPSKAWKVPQRGNRPREGSGLPKATELKPKTKVSKFYPNTFPILVLSVTAFFLSRPPNQHSPPSCKEGAGQNRKWEMPSSSLRSFPLPPPLVSTCHTLNSVQQACGFLEQSKTQGQVVPQQRHQCFCPRMHCHEPCTKPSK